MDSAIRVAGLTKRYGRTLAVDRLSLEVQRGEVFGFLGPNGAGKSTTIRVLTGVLKPTAGEIEVAGFDVTRNPLEAKRHIGYLPENPYLYPKLTGREFLRFMADLHQVESSEGAGRAARLFDLLGLAEKADRLVESYSRGMKQKLALSAALLHEPEVLFLDEPTTGLDPRSARIVKDLLADLARRGRTVFFSTHVLEIAQRMCDRVGIIDGGRLLAVGTLDQLREREHAAAASLEDIFLRLTGQPQDAEHATYLET